jgi:hypothetical protein
MVDAAADTAGPMLGSRRRRRRYAGGDRTARASSSREPHLRLGHGASCSCRVRRAVAALVVGTRAPGGHWAVDHGHGGGYTDRTVSISLRTRTLVVPVSAVAGGCALVLARAECAYLLWLCVCCVYTSARIRCVCVCVCMCVCVCARVGALLTIQFAGGAVSLGCVCLCVRAASLLAVLVGTLLGRPCVSPDVAARARTPVRCVVGLMVGCHATVCVVRSAPGPAYPLIYYV